MRLGSISILSAFSAALYACGPGAGSAPNNDDVQAQSYSSSGEENRSGSLQKFASTMAAIDQFEIQSSKLAETKASSPAIRSFARRMIAAHTSSTSKLRLTVAGKTPPITVPTAMTADQRRTIDELQSKTGSEFDRAYAEAQVAAHDAALTALHDYAASGDDPQLQLLAHRMIPTVSTHLRHARELK